MQQLVTQRIISKGLSYSIIIGWQIKEGNGKANHLATTFFNMADILDDEILELEGLFASDNSSMRNRHIEFARRDYVKLKQLGYVRAPSELKLNEYLWVDVHSYLQPRTQVEKIEENLEIRTLQHPNGLWTYGVFVSYGTRGWSFLPGLFTGLFRSENEAHDTAINSLVRFLQEDKKAAKLVKKLKGRLSGTLQLDLFAGFVF